MYVHATCSSITIHNITTTIQFKLFLILNYDGTAYNSMVLQQSLIICTSNNCVNIKRSC